MYCNECGAKVDDSALVCPNCGHQLPAHPPPVIAPIPEAVSPEQTTEAPQTTPPNSGKRRGGCGWAMTAGLLVGCALLLVIGLAALGVYQGMQERNRLNSAASLEHYQKGLEQLSAGNYDLARAEFELAAQLDSKNREAAVKLSEVEVLLQNLPTPTSVMRHQTAMTLYNEARALYNQGDWAGVIARLDQVQALEPDYEKAEVTNLLIEAYYKGGLKLVEEGRMEEAIRYFDGVLQLRPGDQQAFQQKRLASLYAAGLGYWKANWQGVIDNLSALYQLKPDYKDTRRRLHDAYVAYGDVLYDKGDWCSARDRYDSALNVLASDDVKARRDEAAQRCAVAPAPTGTPPARGTYVGRLLKIEDVGRKEAMMIRGYVLDAQGKPVPNIQVGLSAFDWSAPPATTNSEGVFAFDGLGNPVTYTVKLIGLPAVPLDVAADWSKLVWVEFRPQP